MIWPHTSHRKGGEKTNGSQCKWVGMTPCLWEKNTWLPCSGKEERAKEEGALWGKGTTHYMHGSVSTNNKHGKGRAIGFLSRKGHKNVPSSLGYHVLIPKRDRIDATSSVEKLHSQSSDANDANDTVELVNQSTPFATNTSSWRIFKWHYSINYVTQYLTSTINSNSHTHISLSPYIYIPISTATSSIWEVNYDLLKIFDEIRMGHEHISWLHLQRIWHVCTCSLCVMLCLLWFLRAIGRMYATTNIGLLATLNHETRIGQWKIHVWLSTLHHLNLLQGLYPNGSKDIIHYWHWQVGAKIEVVVHKQTTYSKCLGCVTCLRRKPRKETPPNGEVTI